MFPFLVAITGLDWFLHRRQGELTLLGLPRLVQAALWGGVLFAVLIFSQTIQEDVFVYQGF